MSISNVFIRKLELQRILSQRNGVQGISDDVVYGFGNKPTKNSNYKHNIIKLTFSVKVTNIVTDPVYACLPFSPVSTIITVTLTR